MFPYIHVASQSSAPGLFPEISLPQRASSHSLSEMGDMHRPFTCEERTVRALRKVQLCRQEDVDGLRVAGNAISAKLVAACASVARLGVDASPALRENIHKYHDLLMALRNERNVVDPQATLRSFQGRADTLVQRIDREVSACACIVAGSVEIDSSVIQKAFPDHARSIESHIAWNRQHLVESLIVTGTTQRETIRHQKTPLCELKVRYYDEQIQILTRKHVGKGGHKRVCEVAVISGPKIDRISERVFVYAKPLKGDSQEVYHENQETLQKEVIWATIFRMKKLPNLVQMTPVHKKHGSQDVLKGAAMPLYDRGDIRGFISGLGNRPLFPAQHKECLLLARDVAVALEGLHKRNIIHGDVKPENIFIATEGGKMRAVLGDLGLVIEARNVFSGYQGTSSYIAPEMWASEEKEWNPTTALDMWSFGLTLAEMIFGSGNLPMLPQFRGDFCSLSTATKVDSAIQLRHTIVSQLDCSDPVQKLIVDLLSVVSGDRPSASDVVSRLTESVDSSMEHVGVCSV